MIFRMIRRINEHIIFYLFRRRQIRKKNILEKKAYVDPLSTLEGFNKIGAYSSVQKSDIGYASYCGKYCNIQNTKIGKYCSIGAHLTIIRGQHPIHKNVSTHPSFFSTRKQCGMTYVDKNLFVEEKWADEEGKYSVVIGNDVWIGTNVSILEGIKIGDGAVIGAGAMVVKDIEPYSIYGGVPAKMIKKRFTEPQIDFLCKDKWWDKDETWIKEHLPLFLNIDQYIEVVASEEEIP